MRWLSYHCAIQALLASCLTTVGIFTVMSSAAAPPLNLENVSASPTVPTKVAKAEFKKVMRWWSTSNKRALKNYKDSQLIIDNDIYCLDEIEKSVGKVGFAKYPIIPVDFKIVKFNKVYSDSGIPIFEASASFYLNTSIFCFPENINDSQGNEICANRDSKVTIIQSWTLTFKNSKIFIMRHNFNIL